MNSTAIWHLFRADVRRLRWLIGLTLVLLGLEALPYLLCGPWDFPYWSGSWSSSMPEAYREHPWHIMPFFGFAAVFLAAAIGWHGVSVTALRPVRRRELVSAKLLALTLFLYLPQSLAIFITLCKHGIAWPDALPGLAAAAKVFVPLWLSVAAFGRLAGSLTRFLGAVAASIACYAWLGALLRKEMADPVEVLTRSLLNPWGRNAGPLEWWMTSLSAAVLLGLVHLTARRWQPGKRCAVGSVALLAIAIVLSTLDWHPIPQGGEKLITPTELDLIQPSVPQELYSESTSLRKKKGMVLNSTISTHGLPPGAFCAWRAGPVVLTQNSQAIASRGSSGSIKLERILDNILPGTNLSGITPAMASALPAESSFSQISRGDFANPNAGQGIGFGFLEFTNSAPFSLTTPTSVSVELTGNIYRYERILDLPLPEKDAQFRCHSGCLTIRSYPDPNTHLPLVDLSFQHPMTGLGASPWDINIHFQLYQTWCVCLYLPASGEIVTGLNGNHPLSRQGHILSGGGTHRMVLRFDAQGKERVLTPPDLVGARLIILEPTLIGQVRRHLATPPLPIKSNADLGASDFFYACGPRMEPRDFYNYPHGKRPDPTTATSEACGRWLELCLANISMHDMLEAEFTLWLPRHLPLLLRTASIGGSAQRLTKAIIQTLPESRKGEIISNLHDHPWLLEVLRARGWLRAARNETLQLLTGHTILDGNQLTCIATLCEPRSTDALLDKLEQNGDVSLYRQLRLHPEIEPRLTETVNRYFQRYSPHGKPPVGAPTSDGSRLKVLRLPLAHGIPEALSEALILHRWLSPAAPKLYAEILSEYFWLPPGMKRDSKAAAEYLLLLRPEHCRWDPLTRRWMANQL